MGFNLMYWTSMGCLNFLVGSILEKYGNFWENGHTAGLGNTIRANKAESRKNGIPG